MRQLLEELFAHYDSQLTELSVSAYENYFSKKQLGEDHLSHAFMVAIQKHPTRQVPTPEAIYEYYQAERRQMSAQMPVNLPPPPKLYVPDYDADMLPEPIPQGPDYSTYPDTIEQAIARLSAKIKIAFFLPKHRDRFLQEVWDECTGRKISHEQVGLRLDEDEHMVARWMEGGQMITKTTNPGPQQSGLTPIGMVSDG